MAKVKYIVHGLDCTTGEPMQHRVSDFKEACDDMETWVAWWKHFKDHRNLGGSELDFWIEKQVIDYVTPTIEANREQVEWMLEMAASAYACWKGIDEDHPTLGKRGKERLEAKYRHEYNCYLHCLDMFVKGNILDTEAAVKAYSRDKWNF